MILAQVYRMDGWELLGKCQDTGQMVTAKVAPHLLKEGEGVVVGDYVELASEGEGLTAQLIRPRRNEVYRMLVRNKRRKVSASNVDYLVIVCSVSRPSYKRGLIDRYLVRASQWKIDPIVVFNKMDKYDDGMDLAFELERLHYREIPIFQTSAKGHELHSERESMGLSELKEKLSHKLALFLGQSGVGKSKLISTLSGGQINLKSGSIGKAGKGKHTTTWSELVETESLSFIDSPGIRSMGLGDIPREQLIQFFPGLHERARHCQFSDCAHGPSSQGCHFYENQSYSSGRERRIVLSYLDSYHRLFSEL